MDSLAVVLQPHWQGYTEESGWARCNDCGIKLKFAKPSRLLAHKKTVTCKRLTAAYERRRAKLILQLKLKQKNRKKESLVDPVKDDHPIFIIDSVYPMVEIERLKMDSTNYWTPLSPPMSIPAEDSVQESENSSLQEHNSEWSLPVILESRTLQSLPLDAPTFEALRESAAVDNSVEMSPPPTVADSESTTTMNPSYEEPISPVELNSPAPLLTARDSTAGMATTTGEMNRLWTAEEMVTSAMLNSSTAANSSALVTSFPTVHNPQHANYEDDNVPERLEQDNRVPLSTLADSPGEMEASVELSPISRAGGGGAEDTAAAAATEMVTSNPIASFPSIQNSPNVNYEAIFPERSASATPVEQDIPVPLSTVGGTTGEMVGSTEMQLDPISAAEETENVAAAFLPTHTTHSAASYNYQDIYQFMPVAADCGTTAPAVDQGYAVGCSNCKLSSEFGFVLMEWGRKLDKLPSRRARLIERTMNEILYAAIIDLE